ncbi:hypothetical protein LTR53_018398 [Teratosphaeriaceae sp. CCFEE 6253]|nr:hypothetical protein LTR53_018398 [Teratosphaeriaceae sp. CCFEE 6253]
MNAEKTMKERHGTQAGDPVKGARAMWDIAQLPDPPLRTVIGSDAYTAIMGKIKTYGENYPKYADLANSTDVEGYQRPS